MRTPEARENANDQIWIWLVQKVTRVSWTNHITKWSKTKAIPDYFRYSIKNCSNYYWNQLQQFFFKRTCDILVVNSRKYWRTHSKTAFHDISMLAILFWTFKFSLYPISCDTAAFCLYRLSETLPVRPVWADLCYNKLPKEAQETSLWRATSQVWSV